MHSSGSLYEEEFDINGGAPVIRYMVATMPRSGSTFVTSLLWRTGVLGAPLEYLNSRMNKRQIEQSRDLLEYWSTVQRRRTGINGVFGWKMFIRHYQDMRDLNPEILPLLSADKIIYLDRRDEASHAVSHWRAIETQSWFAESPELHNISYDRGGIQDALTILRNQRNAWERLFSVLQAQPLRIFYEDFLSEPDKVISLICDYIGVFERDGAKQLHIPLPVTQRNNQTIDWADSFRIEMK